MKPEICSSLSSMGDTLQIHYTVGKANFSCLCLYDFVSLSCILLLLVKPTQLVTKADGYVAVSAGNMCHCFYIYSSWIIQDVVVGCYFKCPPDCALYSLRVFVYLLWFIGFIPSGIVASALTICCGRCNTSAVNPVSVGHRFTPARAAGTSPFSILTHVELQNLNQCHRPFVLITISKE